MTKKIIEDLFYSDSDLDHTKINSITDTALQGMDDGELFMEFTQSESLVFDDGRMKSTNLDTNHGFGLRGVLGEETAFSHSSDISIKSIRKAAETIQSVKSGKNSQHIIASPEMNNKFYSDANPMKELSFGKKVKLLEDIDSFARAKDSLVRQVSISLASSWQVINIVKPGGLALFDIRPLVRLNIQIVVGKDSRQEVGSYGFGGRSSILDFTNQSSWEEGVNHALTQGIVNLESVPAPAGEMTVVLGPGWPGILLHEAIGHGLEGDFNRKNTSAFSNLMGEKIAAEGVTVIDDGTLLDRRGSLTIDDEGTPTNKTVLIENGILKNYLHDRLNARLMNMEPTGNGRRQSYAHSPMPRMTNTYMLSGNRENEEIINSVSKGLYAVNFGGGQVDITSGKFVFSCTEAYEINNGKICAPVKGATIIGNGPDVLTKISHIGNDMSLDPGIGTCGKNGQGVPVGVGQPTLRIDGITVGGTA